MFVYAGLCRRRPRYCARPRGFGRGAAAIRFLANGRWEILCPALNQRWSKRVICPAPAARILAYN